MSSTAKHLSCARWLRLLNIRSSSRTESLTPAYCTEELRAVVIHIVAFHSFSPHFNKATPRVRSKSYLTKVIDIVYAVFQRKILVMEFHQNDFWQNAKSLRYSCMVAMLTWTPNTLVKSSCSPVHACTYRKTGQKLGSRSNYSHGNAGTVPGSFRMQWRHSQETISSWKLAFSCSYIPHKENLSISTLER